MSILYYIQAFIDIYNVILDNLSTWSIEIFENFQSAMNLTYHSVTKTRLDCDSPVTYPHG